MVIGRESQGVERKAIAILRVLQDSTKPVGAKVIARRLKDFGVELGERAVRYHLKLMDERGLTRPLTRRDGREITQLGLEELRNALVSDKLGFVLEKIELQSFRTSFDIKKRAGLVPINISFFSKARFPAALKAMMPVFDAGLCVSNLVKVGVAGERLGDIYIPDGKVGIATVCSLIMNGCLLKAGIPMDSRFGGVLQMRNREPLRFVDLIYYSGSTIDPSEVFIRANMTDVRGVINSGNGKILANFRELPMRCKPVVDEVIEGLKAAGMNAVVMEGNVSESVCDIQVGLNRVGLILIGGLTPVAAAEEAGVEAESHAMSTVLEYDSLVDIKEIVKEWK